MHLKPVYLVPHELCGSAIDGGNHRLAAAPCFQHDNSERLITAGDAYNITAFIKVCERSVSLETDKPCGMSYAQLVCSLFDLPPHFAVAGKNELGPRMELQNKGNRFD